MSPPYGSWPERWARTWRRRMGALALAAALAATAVGLAGCRQLSPAEPTRVELEWPDTSPEPLPNEAVPQSDEPDSGASKTESESSTSP